jgi:hypothetical protein
MATQYKNAVPPIEGFGAITGRDVGMFELPAASPGGRFR